MSTTAIFSRSKHPRQQPTPVLGSIYILVDLLVGAGCLASKTDKDHPLHAPGSFQKFLGLMEGDSRGSFQGKAIRTRADGRKGDGFYPQSLCLLKRISVKKEEN
jgi:hypothetical protein